MSTAIAFKYHRPFPFCESDATDPGATYDYIPLTSTGWDLGLSEAMRIWWLLETIEFTPTGSFGTSLVPAVFSHSFRYPNPDNTDLLYYEITSCSLCKSTTDTSQVANSPSDRVCISGNTNPVIAKLDYSKVVLLSTTQENSDVNLVISCISGEWRLYYKFLFEVTLLPLGEQGIICNPENDGGGTNVSSGTFSLFGYSLNWVAQNLGPDSGVSGLGLSATSGFFTF